MVPTERIKDDIPAKTETCVKQYFPTTAFILIPSQQALLYQDKISLQKLSKLRLMQLIYEEMEINDKINKNLWKNTHNFLLKLDQVMR